MMIGRIAFAAGLLLASSLGGVALGSYTIGGFRFQQPPDIIAGLAVAQGDLAAAEPALVPQPEPVHECLGCDAKLHREVDWYAAAIAYTEGPQPDPGYDWAPDEALPAAAPDEKGDHALAVYEPAERAESEPVVLPEGRPLG